jgi:hypothetical protein
MYESHSVNMCFHLGPSQEASYTQTCCRHEGQSAPSNSGDTTSKEKDAPQPPEVSTTFCMQ